jgi:hypothetical protein
MTFGFASGPGRFLGCLFLKSWTRKSHPRNINEVGHRTPKLFGESQQHLDSGVPEAPFDLSVVPQCQSLDLLLGKARETAGMSNVRPHFLTKLLRIHDPKVSVDSTVNPPTIVCCNMRIRRKGKGRMVSSKVPATSEPSRRIGKILRFGVNDDFPEKGRTFLLSLIVIPLLIIACNKEDEMLSEAKSLGASGNLRGAVRVLETLRSTAPDAEEVGEARRLAVEWLLAEVDRTKDADERVQLLEQAKTWNPRHGGVHARVCDGLFQGSDPKTVEACLSELPEMDQVPEKLAKELSQKLRRRNLASSDETEDWKSLVNEFPESVEAESVLPRLKARLSLCHAMDGYLKLPEETLTKLRLLELSALNEMKSGDAVKGVAAIEKVQKYAESSKRETESKLQEVLHHQLVQGEDRVRDELEWIYRSTKVAHRNYADAFRSARELFGVLGQAEVARDEMVRPRATTIRDLCGSILSSGDQILGIRKSDERPIEGKVVPEEQVPSGDLLPGPSAASWEKASECIVKGSSALSCETKILDGYFRAICGKNLEGAPVGVSYYTGAGSDSVAKVTDGKMVLLHPYKSGTKFMAEFHWGKRPHMLTVDWPSGAPMPPMTGVFE